MKIKGLLALLSLVSLVLIFSCSKINESTELGDELIPSVDNVNTFETTLDVEAAFFPFNDSSQALISDNMALGRINDPAFGTTNADMYFNLSSQVYGSYPFRYKDSVVIDSVVLSLAYRGAYGDTVLANAAQITVQVSEIANSPEFADTVNYRFDHPAFATTGPSLGSKSYTIKNVTDSQVVVTGGDTSKVANVLRIKFNDNSLGEKLKSFDTTANGAYRHDTLFRKAFRGLAVKTIGSTGNGTLTYFNLTDAKTQLLVYYKITKIGKEDTAVATYVHNVNTQANSIVRTPGGEYSAKLGQASSQKLYIQSSPGGSYIGIRIPGLDTFPNKVIHRAELIAYRVPSDNPGADHVFFSPNRLILDHKGDNNSKDSAYLFQNDIQPGFDGSLDLDAFGGRLKSDESYRFNLTRYVQGIVTRGERNDSLRLYAPLRTKLFVKNAGQFVTISSLDAIARGRVVIGGRDYPDPARRLRLRIIYSNL